MHSENTITKLNPKDFKASVDGKSTALFNLENSNGIRVAVTNYGGRVISWQVPDKNGHFEDIVLGFDNIDDYLEASEKYYGAIIGRFANRINEGKFSLKGKEYSLAVNNSVNHLHGGIKGFHNVVWDAQQIDKQHLELQYHSDDGEEGYPGNVKVKVDYILTDNDELKIQYTAETDQPTIINLTNHSFFNLGGAASGTINGHELEINAEKYTPINDALIPTGKFASVKGTPFDFRDSKRIGKDLEEDHIQLEYGEGYDHNFVISKDNPGELAKAARAYDPESGRILELLTTEPGMQFYGGNHLHGADIGKEGKPYKYRSAFCLESQHYPDAPNQPNFPSVVLEPDSIYNSLSIYRISTV